MSNRYARTTSLDSDSQAQHLCACSCSHVVSCIDMVMLALAEHIDVHATELWQKHTSLQRGRPVVSLFADLHTCHVLTDIMGWSMQNGSSWPACHRTIVTCLQRKYLSSMPKPLCCRVQDSVWGRLHQQGQVVPA